MPVSDHCDGERFFNPSGQRVRPIGDVVKWQRTREKSAWPEAVPLTLYPPPPHVDSRAIAATFVGHSTFLLRTTNAVVLTDPMFATHAGLVARSCRRASADPRVPNQRAPDE